MDAIIPGVIIFGVPGMISVRIQGGRSGENGSSEFNRCEYSPVKFQMDLLIESYIQKLVKFLAKFLMKFMSVSENP